MLVRDRQLTCVATGAADAVIVALGADEQTDKLIPYILMAAEVST